VSVVATCYLLGVSTWRMDKLVQSLGITSLSRSQVSRMATDLDAQVTVFRTRPLGDSGPFTFVAADALPMKVREQGRVVNAVVDTQTSSEPAAASSAAGPVSAGLTVTPSVTVVGGQVIVVATATNTGSAPVAASLGLDD
jgi:Transposase, Mutator family